MDGRSKLKLAEKPEELAEKLKMSYTLERGGCRFLEFDQFILRDISARMKKGFFERSSSFFYNFDELL